MSFTRINPPGWSTGQKLTSSQITALDIDHANALDKTTAGDTLFGTVTLGTDVVHATQGRIICPNSSGITLQAGQALTANALGSIQSLIAGGIGLGAGSQDWPTFYNGLVSGPRSRTLYQPLDRGVLVSPNYTGPGGTAAYETVIYSPYNPSGPIAGAMGFARGGFVTQVVSPSTGASVGYYCPLTALHNCIGSGGVLASVTLQLAPATHTQLPGFMPRLGIFALEMGLAAGSTVTMSSTTTYAVDPSATLGAYNAPHEIVYTPNQNNVIDTSQFAYFAIILDEGDPTAMVGNFYQGLQLSFTGIENMSW